MFQGQRQQVVGEPGVLGQHRAVQVGRDHAAGVDPLAAVATVVAEAEAHTAEGPRLAEEGAAAMVFKADQQTRLPPGKAVHLGHDVADQAPLAGPCGQRLEVEQAEAGQLAAVGRHVAPAQELQAGAHREHHAAVVDHGGEPGPQAGEIGGRGLLHAVLAAPHEDEVAAGRRLVAELERVPADGEAAQRGAACQGAPRCRGRRRCSSWSGRGGPPRGPCRRAAASSAPAHWRTTSQPPRAPRTSLSAV